MLSASRSRSSVLRTTLFAVLLGVTACLSPRSNAQNGKHIYPEISAAQTDLHAALAQAKREHKRVIVDFGGDWCGDCQVLDIYFHQQPNADLLARNFVKVNINIGHIDANLDVGKRCGVVLSKGVPALAVLDGNGKVVFAQQAGEFEDMRHMQSTALTDFLNKWKS